MSHQLLRHIFGTRCGCQRIFCVLMYGGPTSTRVIWLMGLVRRGMNSRRESEQGEGNGHTIQPPLAKREKKKVYKKFLGQSATISHHLKNLVNSGLWQIQPVTRAVAFFAAAKSFWPELLPRLLDPHKNP